MLFTPIGMMRANTGGGATTPSLRGTAVNTQNSGISSHTVNLVGSAVEGNYQILVASSAGQETFDTPSGWTSFAAVQFGGSGVLALQAFYRLITSGNSAETTVSLTAGGGTFNSNCATLEVADWGSVDVASSQQYSSGSTMSHTGYSVTTTAANCLVIEMMNMRTSAGGTAPTPGAAYSQTNNLLMWGAQDVASAGATTGLSFTSVDSENNFPQLTVAIAP